MYSLRVDAFSTDMFYIFPHCLQCSLSPYLGSAQSGGDATWVIRRGSAVLSTM